MIRRIITIIGFGLFASVTQAQVVVPAVNTPLIGANATSCSGLGNYAQFANTSGAPTGTTISIYDTSQCVPWATLNQTTHTIGLGLSQAMSGSTTLYNWNSLSTTSDSQNCAFCTDLSVTHVQGGATVRGAHEPIFAWITQTSANSGAGTTVLSAINGIGQTNSGDGGTGTGNSTAAGTYFGGNLICRNSATNVYNCYGAENDLQSSSGSSARYAFAQALVNNESVQAAIADAAIGIYSGGRISASGGGGPWGPGVGFHNGILFAELGNNGLVPIDPTGSVLSTHLETLPNIPVSYGIDLRGFSVTNCSFASVNFCVNGSGQVQVANATARSHALDVGPDSGTNIVQINGGSSSSTGAVLSFSAAGTTWSNIGFPSAILGGTFSTNLGISGFTGINLYTNNVLAQQIDTGQNTTFKGQIYSATGAPTIATGACGTGTNGAVIAGSTNQSGQITIGAAATTTCTITWSTTLAVAPNACVFFPMNATAAATGTTIARVGAPSTTEVVLSGSALAGANYAYVCV